MSQGIRDLFASERGTICVLLLLAAAVLVVAGRLDVDRWIEFAKWIAVTLVVSKTATGALETLSGTAAPPAGVPG